MQKKNWCCWHVCWTSTISWFFVSVCRLGVPGCFTHPWPPPVLGISSPWVWVWLLEGGDSHSMAAPDMIFGLQGMDVPACPVGCCPAESTPGQASRWGPYSPGSRPNILGCCRGPNRAQKTVKSTCQVHKGCIWYVLQMYQRCIMDELYV